jgi:DNA-directed RNA polymerase specialized sigma subunit
MKKKKTTEAIQKPPKKRKMEKKQSSQYFTKEHENAILEYASILDHKRKNVLYETLIQPSFDEMVDKIVYTYKFNILPNIDDLKHECKTWLTTILDKYDVSKGSKAFSYFSVITKNWFIHKVKKNNNRKEVYLEDLLVDPKMEDEFAYDENYGKRRESEEFWECFYDEMQDWNFDELKPNEEKVYKAIQILFSDMDNIEIFNKKAVYLYMREITGLNTKQIVSSLKKFRGNYNEFRADWDNGDI